MWQGIRSCYERKPVFVSIGPVAASGGYYMACAAHRIYVNPGSIVGSIGVVGGKLAFGQLYEKIGISIRRRSRGPMSDMFNSVEPFNPQQRAVISKSMQLVYEQFTQRVTQGREEKIPDVEAVAQGRLFTGRQAVANGLADELGGLETALEALATKLGMEAGTYDIVTLPKPKSFAEHVQKVFEDFGLQTQAPMLPALVSARLWLGPTAWGSTQPILEGIMLMQREPVLALMPRILVWR